MRRFHPAPTGRRSLCTWRVACFVFLLPALLLGSLGLMMGRLADRSLGESGVSLMALDTSAPAAVQARPLPMAAAAIAPPSAAVIAPQPAPAAPAPIVETSPVVVAAPQPTAEQPIVGPTFDGRPIRKVREMSMLITAYSPDARSCGIWADGITASGYSVWTNGMRLVAADTRILPFGTIVTIPGYNDEQPVQVLDRGGAIKGNRLDVLYPTHERALEWGVQRHTVTVWEYAD